MARFPHLQGAPAAYGAGREVYEQIPGDFDQGRWADATAHAKLMSVPWCGDYDNVVAFESEGARDAWLDAAEGHAFDTSWRRPPEGTYKVEVPYTSALWYNYLVLDFPTPTSDEQPLPGTRETRYSRLCYFVTDARPSAGSTTELTIDLDVWTTFSYSLDVSYLQLVQGHAPMKEVSPERFLDSPLTTSRHLLVPDVDAGEAALAASSHECVLDSATLALVITTADVAGTWGDKYGSTPTDPITRSGAGASPEAWAVGAGELERFLTDATSQHPSFLQTVFAIASVPSRLVTLGASVTFCGHALRRAVPTAAELPLVSLSPDDFGYETAYAGIAKLYTSPYAHLEVTDETGAVSVVRVEDTTGTLGVMAQLSLAWPYVSVDTTLTGTGRSTAVSSLTWQVLGSSASARLAGRWYETLSSHDVPLFSVRESSATSYDWSAHWTNAQRQTAAQNSYDSATASNATAQTNAGNNASNVTANNAVTVAMNNANVAVTNSANTTGVGYSNDKLRTDVQYDIGNSNAAFDAEMAQLGVAATNNDARATATGVTSAVGGIAQTAASALSGDIGGAVGALASTIGSVANTAVGWQTANASITVSQSNNTQVYNQAVTSAYGKQDASIDYNSASTSLSNTTASTINSNNNDAATSIAGNNASLINTNAANVRTTADANAQRALNTAQSAIANDTAQASLGKPVTHGEQRPGSSAVRPMLVQATVVTESPGEIALAGEHMLRYGYACDFSWKVSDWCPCDRFCFWRASDVWMTGSGNVSERYQNAFKNILVRGVTVWKHPEDIGRVSVYDNGF